MTKTDMTIAIKENQRGVLNIGIFEFRICFEFSASRFGFASPCPPWVVYPHCRATDLWDMVSIYGGFGAAVSGDHDV